MTADADGDVFRLDAESFYETSIFRTIGDRPVRCTRKQNLLDLSAIARLFHEARTLASGDPQSDFLVRFGAMLSSIVPRRARSQHDAKETAVLRRFRARSLPPALRLIEQEL